MADVVLGGAKDRLEVQLTLGEPAYLSTRASTGSWPEPPILKLYWPSGTVAWSGVGAVDGSGVAVWEISADQVREMYDYPRVWMARLFVANVLEATGPVVYDGQWFHSFSSLVDAADQRVGSTANVEGALKRAEAAAEVAIAAAEEAATLAASNDAQTAVFVANPVSSTRAALDAEYAREADVAAAAALAASASAAVDAEAALARDASNLASGTIDDARIPSTIARDAEVTAAVAAEAAARDAAIATRAAADAATYVSFERSDTGAPITGGHIVVKVDPTTHEIVDIVWEA